MKAQRGAQISIINKSSLIILIYLLMGACGVPCNKPCIERYEALFEKHKEDMKWMVAQIKPCEFSYGSGYEHSREFWEECWDQDTIEHFEAAWKRIGDPGTVANLTLYPAPLVHLTSVEFRYKLSGIEGESLHTGILFTEDEIDPDVTTFRLYDDPERGLNWLKPLEPNWYVYQYKANEDPYRITIPKP